MQEGCLFETNDYGKMPPHLFQAYGIGDKLQCLHCNQEFSNERVYEYHITHKHKACKRWLKTKYRLIKHWRDYHKDKTMPNFICHMCGKDFQQKGPMDTHIKAHSDLKAGKGKFWRQ